MNTSSSPIPKKTAKVDFAETNAGMIIFIRTSTSSIKNKIRKNFLCLASRFVKVVSFIVESRHIINS